jgi:uncharacterized protein
MFGEKAFEQAAGFLRVPAGANPLDASAVHPEAYGVVERILARAGVAADRLIGNRELLRRLRPAEFTDERFGEPTVRDIIAELEKPGRDPRGEFVAAEFREGVEKLSDLQAGMQLQGVVTNVAAFGAFVDIGVHQDGLVHVSELSERFVRDPREVVRAGQVVSVRVVEVDLPRQRIALSMRPARDGEPTRRESGPRGGAAGARPPASARPGSGAPSPSGRGAGPGRGAPSRSPAPAAGGALAEAFARASGRDRKS